jgi:hypothetical protein
LAYIDRVLGAAMIGVGVLGGWRESDRNPDEKDEFSLK